MIVIASKEEKELIQRLREVGGEANNLKQGELSAEIIRLKTQISDLEIAKSKIKETHEREERELKHMVGLEKKRQEFEIDKAKKEVSIQIREENLKAQTERFEENLKFNTERFEKMETYLKDMFSDVLERLPNINMEISKVSPRKR